MKYPTEEHIKEHREQVWTAMIQYFGGYVSIENVEACIRSLMGDAALWVNNNHKEIDLEEVKKKIGRLHITL